MAAYLKSALRLRLACLMVGSGEERLGEKKPLRESSLAAIDSIMG